MDEPWAAEVALDLDRARELVAAALPELAGRPIRVLGEGFDNLAVLVDGVWVVRLPRRAFGGRAMADELAVLPHLVGALPAPISAPERVGRPVEGYPWTIAAYRRRPGTSGCTPGLDTSGLAVPLGRFLGTLHALPAAHPAHSAAPPDRIRRMDRDGRRPRLVEAARSLGLDAAAIDARLAALSEAPDHAGPPVLVHGDLHPRHVLVGPEGGLAEVIDWGDTHVGDPAQDLSIAWTLLGSDQRPGFFAAYRAAGGRDDGAMHDRARFKALHYGVLLEQYGRGTDDVGMRHVARRARLSTM